MAEKTPAEKMRLKAGMSASLLHVPDGLAVGLGVPEGVSVAKEPAAADFILEVATTQAEVEGRLAALEPDIGAETVVWVAYPKGAKKEGYDISRDTIWAFVRTIGLTLVANVAVDATWSAVRVRRQA